MSKDQNTVQSFLHFAHRLAPVEMTRINLMNEDIKKSTRLFRVFIIPAILTGIFCAPAIAQSTRAASVPVSASIASPAPELTYSVEMPQAGTHLFNINLQVRERSAIAPLFTDLILPAWTPGNYKIRNYARNVQDFTAQTSAGAPLQWRKTDLSTWHIETGGARAWRVSYRVHSDERTQYVVDSARLDDRIAFWNNAALLMYPDGKLNAPVTLRVAPPAGWQVVTALSTLDEAAHIYRADNFDALYDAPFLCGSDLKTFSFAVRGVSHQVAIAGARGYDLAALQSDLEKIVAAAADTMNGLPYQNYTFLMIFGPTEPDALRGLEHANSTAIYYPRLALNDPTSRPIFLGLLAHEFFHAWNVKRIRPDVLGPFDYTRANPTRLLWVAEGVTAYYENILLRRAGLMTPQEYSERMTTRIGDLQYAPGQAVRSVEEAGFDAWLKFDQGDENDYNSTVNYYTRGSLLALLLDLEIRGRSDGAHSLDDVMRALYTQYAQRNRNYSAEDFQRLCEQMAGGSLKEFFTRYVQGRGELPYESGLQNVGLHLETTPAGDKATGYFGMQFQNMLVTQVYADGPAYTQGLSVGDQLLSMNGVRITDAAWNKVIFGKRAGEIVHLVFFRGDELRELDIKLGERPPELKIVPVVNPTQRQQRLYADWMKAPLVEVREPTKLEAP